MKLFGLVMVMGGLAPVAALALPPAHVAAASWTAGLVPHHATYDLSLDRSPGGTVIAVDGKMDYRLSDACEAWATSQRLAMSVTDNDGSVAHMVSDYVTWEQKDGTLLRFRLRQTSDRKTVTTLAGFAVRRPDGSGTIHYSVPSDRLVDFPKGTMFPMAQTVALLNGAGRGEKFLAVPLFDGTGDSGAEDSFTVMGAAQAAPAHPRWAVLRKAGFARVTISFFVPGPGENNDTPEYQVTMRYWQNGVSDDIDMDFGDFVVRGNLTDLSPNGKRC